MLNLDNQLFWKFIADNAKADANALRLSHYGKPADFDVDFAITQIECRRKFASKFRHTLTAIPRFVFPNLLAAEQATSDLIAAYHSGLAGQPAKCIDLTAGLGIDIFHIARSNPGCKCVAVELDPLRAECLKWNAAQSALDNIEIVCGDCREVIAEIPDSSFDMAFIDPARRDSAGNRVFSLGDCAPDVVAMLPDIKRIAATLIVKMSPMLDISAIFTQLPGTERLLAVGTRTECRELVALTGRNVVETAMIESVTIGEDKVEAFPFTADEERDAPVDYSDPQAGDYMVEPYPAIMKAGCRRLFAARYGLKKLSPNSQVYFSHSLPSCDVPGTVMLIEGILPYQSKVIKRLARAYPRAMILARNFVCSTEELRRKLAIKEGTSKRIIATRSLDGEPILIICDPNQQ